MSIEKTIIPLTERPPALYTHEVLELVRVSPGTWAKMRERGEAPAPSWRGKRGYIYKTVDIYRFMGLIDGGQEKQEDDDPIMRGLKNLG